MELLIPGLILVALMVYASTRIKKTAAAAFEAETIETDDFVIHKPQGFLNVIGGDPRYMFEAYSRDFGSEQAAEFRQATAKLSVLNKMSAEVDDRDQFASGDVIVNERGEVIDGVHYKIIEAERIDSGIEFVVFYRIAERGGRVYRFEITALAETTDEIRRGIESMLNSFALKSGI